MSASKRCKVLLITGSVLLRPQHKTSEFQETLALNFYLFSFWLKKIIIWGWWFQKQVMRKELEEVGGKKKRSKEEVGGRIFSFVSITWEAAEEVKGDDYVVVWGTFWRDGFSASGERMGSDSVELTGVGNEGENRGEKQRDLYIIPSFSTLRDDPLWGDGD